MGKYLKISVVEVWFDKSKFLTLRKMARRPDILRCFSQFVPKYKPPSKNDSYNFNSFLECYRKLVILTGAGVSTESGIPDYRSLGVGMFSRTSYKPIQYADFLKNPDVRRRYWARNFVGWPRFKSLVPNKIHFFVANIQGHNHEAKLITQNVDGLHSKAGSSQVLELHGNGFWVKCMTCNEIISRSDYQKMLENVNADTKVSSIQIGPDGDVVIPDDDVKDFDVPPCEKCGGIMKPTIVFFGENVPEKTAKTADEFVENCEGILILGTTLTTLSSFRLVEKAYDSGKGMCLVNIGSSRADAMMDLIIETNVKDLILKVEEECYP